MPGDEDGAPILSREHPARVVVHAEWRSMRPERGRRLHVAGAGLAPAKLRIDHCAGMAVGKAEVVLAHVPETVEFVQGEVLRQPVALVVPEPEIAGSRVPVEANGIAHAFHHGFHARAV